MHLASWRIAPVVFSKIEQSKQVLLEGAFPDFDENVENFGGVVNLYYTPACTSSLEAPSGEILNF